MVRIMKLPIEVIAVMMAVHALVPLIFALAKLRHELAAVDQFIYHVFDGFVYTVACIFFVFESWYDHRARRHAFQIQLRMQQRLLETSQILEMTLPYHFAHHLVKKTGELPPLDTVDLATVAFINLDSTYFNGIVHKEPYDMITSLDEIFCMFDVIISLPEFEPVVYKLETINQTYMIMAPIPGSNLSEEQAIDSTARLAVCCMHILSVCALCNIPLRIGINTGPIVAGVVGKARHFYRVFGDVVNGTYWLALRRACVRACVHTRTVVATSSSSSHPRLLQLHRA
ncbi:hypothetical protein EON62_00640 [archaeon]|nr:MAG: hypothetical protein EON62_00640 [archaeon]